MGFFAKLFGLEIDKKNQDKKDNIETFVQKDVEGAHTFEYSGSAGFFTSVSTLQVEETLRKTAHQIKKYREISLQPEADQAIEDVVNEAITSSRTEELVTIDLDQIEDLSDSVKDKIRDEFENVLKLLNYKRKSYDIFRDFYVDGRLYFHKIVERGKEKEGIKELRQIDATSISKVVELEKKRDPETGADLIERSKEYFLYNRTYSHHNKDKGFNQSIAINPDAVTFVHSGLYNIDRSMIIGHLHKAIKPMNQLRMVEDAAVIYRLTRAPERRAFYIDVGRLPRHKAEAHVKEVMARHRNDLQYDASTGEVIDGKKHMHMLEDFYLPRFDGSRGTEIQQIGGGTNLGEMEDVLFFQRKLYKSLNVPITRLEPDNAFTLGRVAEISRDEVNFTKFIDRVLMRFSGIFDDLLGTQLVLKKIMRQDEWDAIKNEVFYDFLKDSFFTELKELEVLRDRVNILRDINEFAGQYYSRDWIKKHVLQQNEDEIEELQKEMDKEKEEMPEPEEDTGGFGF